MQPKEGQRTLEDRCHWMDEAWAEGVREIEAKFFDTIRSRAETACEQAEYDIGEFKFRKHERYLH